LSRSSPKALPGGATADARIDESRLLARGIPIAMKSGKG